MFEFIDEVALLNVQSHPKSIFKFKGASIHRISAEGTSNSYGKSVLRKALMTVFTARGKDKISRQTLIRKGFESCTIIVSSTSGLLVTLYLHLEEKHCYYELEYKDMTIKKYLRDDYQIILDILGFHYLKEEDYSLNFYVTKSTLPFTHFRPRLNYKVLESAKELPEYKLLMDDISDNLTRMEKEIRILDNTAGSYQFHIESLQNTNLEELELHERIVSNWIKYLEPVEQVVAPLKVIANSLKALEEIKMIPVNVVAPHMNNLHSLSESTKELNNLIALNNKSERLQEQYLDPDTVDTYIQPLSEVSQVQQAVTQLAQLNQQLANLPKPIQVVEVEPHLTSLTNIKNLQQATTSLLTLNQQLDTLPKPIKAENVKRHLQAISHVENLQTQVKSFNELKQQLDGKQRFQLPNSELVMQLTTINNVLTATQQYTQQQEQIAIKQQQLAQLKEQVEMLANELDVCVTCGQLITSLEVVHDH
ncbi:MAG: hypothetical protein ABS904_00270 [Solibacillus isronensis]